MTREDLDIALNAASTEYDKKRVALLKEYALANNPYKVDDFITDHAATIQIKAIKFYLTTDNPQCVYEGIQYNKDGKVSKKQDHNTIYQSNIVTTQ